ncbi:MAG: GNAT family N-acetyltransferase [Candidatus Faecousia sp.]|nr:GNAT family N-acetyltransferase [Candidatus Faecousia sp.]
MNEVTLKKIDESNFLDAFGLELGEGQEKFVSNPIRSLAQAYVYYHQCTPFGIYHADQMVGYVLVIYDYDLQEYDIWHLMIDKTQQGKGYGRAAMEQCLAYIAGKPFGASDRVSLTCNRENQSAICLYKSLGFSETGNEEDGEIELSLRLNV